MLQRIYGTSFPTKQSWTPISPNWKKSSGATTESSAKSWT